ncbi:MAG: SiaB family protein kinase [Spirochaetales bacterium]|nr:SiaB family protein kinase [Spirochaetales bacterium]
MINDLHTFKDGIQKSGIICCFTGPFTQDLLIGIGATIKRKMELEGEHTRIILDLFSVLVEETQNIIHHSAERTPNLPSSPEKQTLACGIIVVGKENHRYYIQGGNYIDNDRIAAIREKLDALGHMSRKELDTYYKKQRRQKSVNKTQKAGLGFIEVARKVSKPIEYTFKKIDNARSFFSFIATI